MLFPGQGSYSGLTCPRVLFPGDSGLNWPRKKFAWDLGIKMDCALKVIFVQRWRGGQRQRCWWIPFCPCFTQHHSFYLTADRLTTQFQVLTDDTRCPPMTPRDHHVLCCTSCKVADSHEESPTFHGRLHSLVPFWQGDVPKFLQVLTRVPIPGLARDFSLMLSELYSPSSSHNYPRSNSNNKFLLP